MLRLPTVRPEDNDGHKWRSCILCDTSHTRVYLKFDSGSVLPVTDETLTGDTSGDTGVVTDVTLLSGSWAGGDAKGFVEMKTDTGTDSDGQCLSDDETVTGSTGGSNILTADGNGQKKKYGRLYPESDLVFYDGSWFCRPHFGYRYRYKFQKEADYNIEEGAD